MRGEGGWRKCNILVCYCTFLQKGPALGPFQAGVQNGKLPGQAGRECRVGISASRQPIPVRPIIKAMGKGVPS